MDFDSGYVMTINGASAHGNGTIEVINPATGAAYSTAPRATAADLEAAVDAATRAWPSWRETPLAERRNVLIAAANAIAANAEALARIFTREQGRPLPLALGEIKATAYWLKATAKLDLPVDVTEDTDTRRIEVHHVPLGVICAIVPCRCTANNMPMITIASGRI